MPFCILLAAGCARIHNQFREDGPSVDAQWESPSAADVFARYQPAETRQRGWEVMTTASESGGVIHGPLYMEDPFVDKGRGDPLAPRGSPQRELRIDGADFIALPYSYARYTLNWLMLPVSLVVTPPWTAMESDGVLSRQALGYDHDATRVIERLPQPPPAARTDEAQNSDADP